MSLCELWFETFMAITAKAVRRLNVYWVTKKCSDPQKIAHILNIWSCICNIS